MPSILFHLPVFFGHKIQDMTNRDEVPRVNAGSMADIAFLLLIFFLVTTSIETDTGLDRMLPRITTERPLPIQERNILPILINGADELWVGDEVVPLSDLRNRTVSFLDNGGALPDDPRYCDYCRGKRDPKSSDSPGEAVVSLLSHRETSYGIYIAVQNELVGAFNELRNREARRRYQKGFVDMEAEYLRPETPIATKEDLKSKIKHIQKLFPLNLSEAERN